MLISRWRAVTGYLLLSLGAGCAAESGAIAPATPSPVLSLSAVPSAITFSLPDTMPTPASVELDGTGDFGGQFSVSVADPTQVGASTPSLVRSGVATMALVPISVGTPVTFLGTTVVTVSDGQGLSTNVSVTQAVCGRPENLVLGTTMIYPRQNSPGNPTTGTVAYVDVVSHVAPSAVALHVIVGTHGTLEAGLMQPSAPPPNAGPMPFPPAWAVSTVLAAPLPPLPAGATIRLQIYDDTCQLPLIVGSFST